MAPVISKKRFFIQFSKKIKSSQPRYIEIFFALVCSKVSAAFNPEEYLNS